MLLLNDGDAQNKVAWVDVVNNVNTLNHLAEAGVYAVKVLCVGAVVADEELRAAGIFAAVRHREYATVVVLTLGRGLALDGPAWATCAIADRAATLNNEIWNHAVEGQSVVKA